MRVVAVLSVLLLVCSVFVFAATDVASSDVAAAVSSATQSTTSTTTVQTAPATEESANPTAVAGPSPGFIDGRMNDIKKRVQPATRAFDPKANKQGFGSGQGGKGFRPQQKPGFEDGNGNDGGFGPQQGGPGFGPQENGKFDPQGGFDERQGNDFGPQGPGGFGGGPGFGPNGPDNGFGGEQGPNFGPGPQGNGFEGPRDFRGFGGFDMPPDAIEGMIFSQIGETLDEKYGKENLMQKCGNQPELVGLVMDEFQKSGVNLQTEVCSDIEKGVSFCSEAKSQCEQMGQNQNGPSFGPEEDFKPTCPPDETQWKNMCVQRMKTDWEQNSADRLEDMQLNCQERWQFDRPPDDNCVNGKPRQPMECDKSQWINQCLERQQPEGDYGPEPQGQQPWQQNGPQGQQPWQQQNGPQGQPWQQPNGRQNKIQPPQCPPIDESAKNMCIATGNRWSIETTTNGCPQVICKGDPNQPPAATAVATPTLENTPQPTAIATQPPAVEASTPQPTIEATAAPSIVAAGFSELRLEDIPFNPGGQNQGNRVSATDRCEQEWNRNQPRFQRQCQSMQQKGPQFNMCNEQEFIAQCTADNQKRFEQEKQRRDPEKICAIQVKRDMRNFERYCKDMQKGKTRCVQETEKGCEFGKKQLDKCMQLTSTDNIKKAIENAVAKECRRQSGKGGNVGMDKLRDLVPGDFRSLVDYESDNVQNVQDAAKKVDQKDAGYAITQLLGMQAEQERKDSVALKEQSERLGKTIERLTGLVDQVESGDAKVLLQAQILDLQAQKDSMDGRAKTKEQGANGIFGFLAGLFGGGK